MNGGDKVTRGSDKDPKLQDNLLLTPKRGQFSFSSAKSWAQGCPSDCNAGPGSVFRTSC